jgi:predicted AlkP superfamily pyrophosphatase or phosphodiesterase
MSLCARRNPAVLVAILLAGLAAAAFGPADRETASAYPQSPGASAGSGGTNRPEHLDKPHLILVSFDGFRPDYVDRFELPNFRKVLRRGARARAMVPVFPSLTFPNHYSLVTGLYPEHHGIVGNTFFDPVRSASYSFRDQQSVTDGTWYRGQPIWVTAETQGMVAACFFWPGSEAAIEGVRPTVWNTYDGNVPNKVRVETVLGWLRRTPEKRPHLITLYFSELDTASHGGPLEASAIAGPVESLDAALGQLADGIDAIGMRDQVYLVLTSDHGMVETSASRTVLLSSLINRTDVRVGFTGPVASLHVAGGTEQAERIRDQINARLKNGRAYLRQEIPERYHYRSNPRIGDVLIVMNESWTVGTFVVSKLRIGDTWGQHGWDPALQSMRAMFAIAGPAIREDVTIPEVDNVDVYPLMAELLRLRVPHGIDGRPGYIRRLVTTR